MNSVGNGAASPQTDAVTPALVCNRTTEVRTAIIAAVTGKSTCAAITTGDLAGITSLTVTGNASLTDLKPGDFTGLTGLTTLNLHNNGLTSLPAGIFDDLAALTSLRIDDNSLTALRAGIFDNNAKLGVLLAFNNSLTALPAGIFDNNTKLRRLRLGNNSITSLPTGIFDNNTALANILLGTNNITSLPTGVFDNNPLTELNLSGNSGLACLPYYPATVTPTLDTRTYSACGAAVTASASSLTVGATDTRTYTITLAAYPRGNVTVTPTSSDTAKATLSTANQNNTLTFTQNNWNTAQTVTVTGAAAGSASITHTASGGGYASATTPSVTATVTAQALKASNITTNSATLTLTGHSSLWALKINNNQCRSQGNINFSTNIGSLGPATTYTFYAHTGLNCSSSILTSATFTTLPSQVSGASAAARNTALDVSWAAFSGKVVTGYKVQWKSGAQNYDSTRRKLVLGAASNSTAITGLNNSTAYTVRVTAYNATGDGAASDEVTATPAVGAPLALAKPAVTRGNARVTLTWTAPDNNGSAITGYEYASNENGGSFGTWTAIPSSASLATYTVTSLTNGTAYRFKLRAVNAQGNGAESPQSDSVTPATTPAAPAKPTASAGNTRVTLTWTAPDNGGSTVTKWQYAQKTADNYGSWADICSTFSDSSCPFASSHTVTGLTNGTAYRFKLRAVNAHGNGAESPETDAATPGNTAPAAPAKPTAAAGNTEVTLTWTAPDNGGSAITGYEYAQKAGSTGSFGTWTAISNSADLTAHTVTGLTNGTSYQFKLRAVNSVGNGAQSPQTNAITPSEVCGRTPEARDAIIAVVSGKTTCGAITDTDLAGLDSTLEIRNKPNFTSLRAGDLSGLTALVTLRLQNTGLSSLPAGVFDDLTSLTHMWVNGNSLSGLPAGVFDSLSSLSQLWLHDNSLSSLPAGVFDDLSGLTVLWLHDNSLTGLPAGVFDELTSLTNLNLSGNSGLACLPFIPSSVSTLTLDNTRSTYGACGAAVTVSASTLGVGVGAANTYTVVLDAYPTGSVTVTPASGDTTKATVSSALTFTTANWNTAQTVTVTGVATGSVTVSHTVSGGGYASATAASVTATVTTASLAASAVTETTATLTLSGHAGNWYHKQTAPSTGACSTAITTTTARLTNLAGGTAYTYKAYSDASCATEIASDNFTTIGLTASAVTETTATLNLANWAQNWWHKKTSPTTPAGTCAAVTANTTTASLTSLTANTAHTYQAYSAAGCNTANKIADVTFTTVGLTASAVTQTTATLNLANWTAQWWHKRTKPADDTCTSIAANTATASLTSLTGGTAHTYNAYSTAGCNTANKIADVTFTTLTTPTTPPPSGGGGGGGSGGGGGGSPAPDSDDEPANPFTDDNDSIFEESINKVAAAGITRGCNTAGTLFCPNQRVTRAQMAVFLQRALKLPAPSGDSKFTDSAGFARTAIDAMATAGITLGCNPDGTLFCPDQPVTRGQMAAFLARALKLPTPDVPPAFDDTTNSVFNNAVAAILKDGITRGCDSTGARFCPNQPVTRGQMATFLARALDL